MLRIYAFASAEAGRFLAVPQLSESWRPWAEERLRKAAGRPTDAPAPGCSAP